MPTCPICSAQASRKWVKSGFDIMVCPACTFVFSHPPLAPEEALRLYTRPDRYTRDGAFQPRGGTARRWRSRRLARRLKSVRKEGRVLEVGCGQGDFLVAARQCGFDVVGVEPAPAPAEHSREMGFTVHCCGLDDAPLEASSFDAAVALHVIEHVSNPVRFVQSLVQFLRPAGVILLQMPCASHWKARRAGVNWHYLTPPGHLSFFTTKSLRRLFTRCGLQALSIRQHLLKAHLTAIGRLPSV